jgi:hypothetical protein
MKEYKQLFSILKIDEKFYAVSLYSWAKKSLPAEEYYQFRLDMEKVQTWERNQIELGQAYTYKIYETFNVTPDDAIAVSVGVTYAIDENLELVPEWIYWQNKMQQDPKIVKYNPAVRTN